MALLLGNQGIVPPKIDGCQDVFSSTNVVFSKPRWVPDCEASQCHGCSASFSRIRRRHHCRYCGYVYCGKCCDQKSLLSFLGYTCPERVCVRCHDAAKLVEQALSTQMDIKLLALEVLTNMCSESNKIETVIELGGVYALIHAARIHNEAIRGLVVKALHGLGVHQNLHKFLADSGAITAVCRILSEADEKCAQLILDGVSVLILFSKSVDLKIKVLKAGALEPLLHLCRSVNTTLALVALHCISVIVESVDTHEMIVDNSERHTLTQITALIGSRDEQFQELALKTLAHLSSGSDNHRHRIIQEDIFNGNCLARVLDSRPQNRLVLRNAACLVANLASTSVMQSSSNDLLMALCRLVESYPMSEDIMVHCARGVANFCQCPQNANSIQRFLPFLVKLFFECSHPSIQHHALRMCILFLRHCPDIGNMLGEHGATTILKGLASVPEVLVAMETEVERIMPTISQLDPVAADMESIDN